MGVALKPSAAFGQITFLQMCTYVNASEQQIAIVTFRR